jgi:3-oxoadipate enol-lactonase
MRFRLRSGRALGYRTSGAGDVIVFLHPVGMNAQFWQPVAEKLPLRFRSLAIDAMGHGESDTSPGDFTLDDMAGDVIELVRSLDSGPCILAGCSMGGMVAQGVALRAPEMVRALVLMNSGHTLPAAGRAAMELRAVESRKGMPVIIDATIDRWFSATFQAASPEIVKSVREHLLTCDPIVHSRAWRAIRDLDYAPKLAAVRCPVLVMTGSADVSTPPALSEAMVKMFANGTYREIAGAGHMAPIEQPALVAGWIAEFAAALDRVDAS